MTDHTRFLKKNGTGTEDIKKTSWQLKRYARFCPKSTNSQDSWKVFENSESTGQLELCMVESGHLLVSQGPELLEGFSLLSAQSFLKVLRRSDVLLFRMTAKGEGRIFRVQFAGSSREEALEQCGSAVTHLTQYLPVEDAPCPQTSTQATLPSDLQTPTAPPQAEAQTEEPTADLQEATGGSLSVQHLAQCFLGEAGLSLPLAYSHQTLPSGCLDTLLRLCLLDCGFPALVEQVEAELKKLAQR